MDINDLYPRQLRYLFDRPVSEPPWHHTPREDEEDVFGEDPLVAFEFIERLCRQAQSDLAPYSDDQVGIGLEFIFGANLAGDFKTAEVPFKRREQALYNLFALFRDVFDPRCVPDRSAGSRVTLSKLNNVCYMFWDESPLSNWIDFGNREEVSLWAMEQLLQSGNNSMLPAAVLDQLRQQLAKSSKQQNAIQDIVAYTQQAYANLDDEAAACYRAIATVMQQCLSLRNPACVESGLHGLGHLVPFLPHLAVPIIEAYLKNGKNKTVALVGYAKAAKTGMIQ